MGTHYFLHTGKSTLLKEYKGKPVRYIPRVIGSKNYFVIENDEEAEWFGMDTGMLETNPDNLQIERVVNTPKSKVEMELLALRQAKDELMVELDKRDKAYRKLESVCKNMLAPLSKEEIDAATITVKNISEDLAIVMKTIADNHGIKWPLHFSKKENAAVAERACIEVIARSNRFDQLKI